MLFKTFPPVAASYQTIVPAPAMLVDKLAIVGLSFLQNSFPLSVSIGVSTSLTLKDIGKITLPDVSHWLTPEMILSILTVTLPETFNAEAGITKFVLPPTNATFTRQL